MVLAVLSGFEKLVSLSCGLFDFYVVHIWSQCWSFCFPIGGLQPIFCKPHNSRDLSWQCVVRWPLPLGISLTFRIVPLRVQSGRCGHFVLSLGTVRFKQPGMRPTPVPQKKKVTKKKTKKPKKSCCCFKKKMRGVRAQAQQPSPRLPRLPVSPSLAGAQAQ